MHLVTKAEELWLIYCPPLKCGDIVTLQNLISATSLNQQVGTVDVVYSTNSNRIGIKLDNNKSVNVSLHSIQVNGRFYWSFPAFLWVQSR
jgi:DNA/RNA endonuclease YhcR with UshA esterase domain